MGIESKIDLSWQVRSMKGLVLYEGRTSPGEGPGYWGVTIGRTVGAFPAEKSKSYRLIVKCYRAFEELSAANPRIIVAEHPRFHEWEGYLDALMERIGLDIAFISGLFLLGLRWMQKE
jgi:hypothetical protein